MAETTVEEIFDRTEKFIERLANSGRNYFLEIEIFIFGSFLSVVFSKARLAERTRYFKLLGSHGWKLRNHPLPIASLMVFLVYKKADEKLCSRIFRHPPSRFLGDHGHSDDNGHAFSRF